jgi:uncharacterized protein YjbI with pentapeptide repeats
MVQREALPPLASGSARDLKKGATLDGVEITGVDLSGIRAGQVRLLEFAMTDCSADDLSTQGVRAVDTHLGSLQFQTWTAADGEWRDADFDHMRVGAWLADGTEFVDVTIRECKVDLLSLRQAKLRRVTLRECRIETLDLTDADVSDVVIDGGGIGDLITAGARMSDVDVASTVLDRVSHPGALRGLVMSDQQTADLAAIFADYLGIATRVPDALPH